MTIAGKTFERGFGTHAESSLFIQLDGKANSFTAQVGIDDEVKRRSARRRVYCIRRWSEALVERCNAFRRYCPAM